MTTKAMTTSYVCPPNPQKKKKKKRNKRSRRSAQLAVQRLPRGSGKTFAIHKIASVVEKRLNCGCSSDAVGYYDSNAVPCVRTKFITRIGCSTDSNGYFAVEVTPALVEQYRTAATFSGGSVATWGSYTSASGYDGTNFQSYRTSAMCVRYMAYTAPTDSAGIVTLCVSSPTQSTWNIGSTQQQEVLFIRQYQADACICLSPEGPESQVHEVISSTSQNGWSKVYIGGRAMAGSKGVGEIIIEETVELHITGNTIYNFFLQEAHPNIPQIEAAISNARKSTPQIVDNSNNPNATKKTFWDAAESAAVELVESLAPYALQALVSLI
jgi:hypothetical protein